MIPRAQYRGVPIYLEPYLEWELWRMPDRLIVGRERWPQMVFAFQVQHAILETDPGPLDARLP